MIILSGHTVAPRKYILYSIVKSRAPVVRRMLSKDSCSALRVCVFYIHDTSLVLIEQSDETLFGFLASTCQTSKPVVTDLQS